MKSPSGWCVRSNRLHYCMDCTLHFYQPVQWVPKLLVNVSGWVVWRAKYERSVKCVLFKETPSMKMQEKIASLKQMIFIAVHHPGHAEYHTKSQQAHLLLQLCILTKGWSPKTKLFAPAPFRGFEAVRLMYRGWIKHDAFFFFHCCLQYNFFF